MARQSKKPTIDQLRDLSVRQQAIHDQERRRLARRMHDELSQKATVLAFELSLLAMEMDKKKTGAPWRGEIKKLCALTNDLGLSIRDITNQLHSKILEEFGLAAALQSMANAQEIPCSFNCSAPEMVLPPSVAAGLYQQVGFIIRSVLHPAKVRKVEINLKRDAGRIQLRVSGEHKLSSAHLSSGEGALDWLAIQERVEGLGGSIKLAAVRGVGTIVTISVPETSVCEAAPF